MAQTSFATRRRLVTFFTPIATTHSATRSTAAVEVEEGAPSAADAASTTSTDHSSQSTTSSTHRRTTLLPLSEAWPRLQERLDQIKNPHTGQLDLLSPKHQLALEKHRQKQQQQQPSGNRSNSNDRQERGPQPTAAVLVLLLTVDGQPSLLFTRRAAHLSQHAAEISFPGGHFDATRDVTLQDTAIREALEELYPADDNDNNRNQSGKGNFQSHLKILGTASPLPSIRGVPVTPVLAVNLVDDFSAPITQQFPGDGGTEVDLVFSVPIAQLVAAETTHKLPATRFNFQQNQAPCFPTPDGNIWGLTAYILQPCLHQLLKPVLWQEV